MRRLAPLVLLGAAAILSCEGWQGLSGAGIGYSGGPTVVFISNAAPESMPPEEASAWAWLQQRDEFELMFVQLADLGRTTLPPRSVVWWHYAEHESLPSAALRPAALEALRRHLRGGGSLLLTLLAAPYVVPLEIEPTPPDFVSSGSRRFDTGAELWGLQSRLGHPLLKRFYGGAFTATAPPGYAAAAVYRGESWPAVGRVWAVHKNEDAVDPSVRIGIEYPEAVNGLGHVVTLGAHCYFAAAGNDNRALLEQLVADALAYLLAHAGSPVLAEGDSAPATEPVGAAPSAGPGPATAAGVDSEPAAAVLDGVPRYWFRTEPDVLLESVVSTTVPSPPVDAGTALNAVEGQRSGAELTSYPAEETPFTLASPRLAVHGSQLGRVDQLRVHPAGVLANLRFGIVRAERGVTWLDAGTGQHTYRARPEGVEIAYNDGDVEISIYLTVDRSHAALVTLLTVQSPAAVEVIATWQMDRAAAWPGGEQLFGPLSIGWDEGAGAAVWRDSEGRFAAIAGFGPRTDSHIIGYREEVHLDEQGLIVPAAQSTPPIDVGSPEGSTPSDPGEQNSPSMTQQEAEQGAPAGAEPAAEPEPDPIALRSVAVQAHLEAGQPAVLPFVVAAGDPTEVDVGATFAELISDPGRSWISNAAYYREFLGSRTMGIQLGDQPQRLADAFRWAKVGIEALRAEIPGVANGFLSAYGPRRSSDAWAGRRDAFTGSGALWAAMAADAYGDRRPAAQTLRSVARYQAIDGRVPAAVDASWQTWHDRAIDAALFVIAVENHVRTWGDLVLLEELWPTVERALEQGAATDVEAATMIRSHGRLDRWGAEAEVVTTIELAGLWGAALEAAAQMATWRGDAAGQVRWQDLATTVRTSLNEELQFWNPNRRGFNFARRLDGTFADARTVLPAVPALFGLLDAGNAGVALDSFASSELASDWGVALASDTAIEPQGDAGTLPEATETSGPQLAADIVSPVFTGWAALAEYAYQRDVAGFYHTAANLRLLEHGNLGYASGGMHRDTFGYATSVPHAGAGQALTILPVTRGMLGIRADALGDPQTLQIIPQLPAGWPRVIVDRIRMGNSEFRAVVRRNTGQTEFTITRRSGGGPVNLRLGARVPSDVFISVDPNPVGATIIGEEEIGESPAGRSSTIVAQMTESIATIAFNHGEFPRLAPPDVSLQPGGTSTGLRVIRTRYAGGTLQLELEGLPGEPYTLRLATPWNVSQVTGVPDPSISHPEAGWATIDIMIPGSGPRYRPIELEVAFAR